MRKITFTFGKKRSYERYYEQYMNLIGMDNLEKSRSLIIEKIKRTAAKAGGDQSQREKERTIVETMKADIKGFENSLNREGDIAILIGVVTLIFTAIDIKAEGILNKLAMIIVIITGIIDVYMGYLIIVRKRNADKRGFLLSILEDWKRTIVAELAEPEEKLLADTCLDEEPEVEESKDVPDVPPEMKQRIYEGLYEILKDLYPEEFEDTDPEM